jgi:hypothetical protein
VHWEDANEAELVVTVEFISAINYLFGPRTRFSLEFAARAFQDFIVEAGKLQRLPARGDIPGISNLHVPMDHLLARFPPQVWPLPHPHHCPVSFCDVTPDLDMMEAHLAHLHPEVHQVCLSHTDVQLQLASLLGLGLEVRKKRRGGVRSDGVSEILIGLSRCTIISRTIIEITKSSSPIRSAVFGHRFSATTTNTGVGRL